MMRCYIILITCCWGLAAHAAETPKLDPAVCQMVTTYKPSADIAYKAGVDVHGHYVAPADADGGAPSPLPTKINIPLTVSLAKVLNLDTTQYPYNQLGAGTEAQLGTMAIDGNNVTLNGKPLSNDQQSKLAVLCTKQ